MRIPKSGLSLSLSVTHCDTVRYLPMSDEVRRLVHMSSDDLHKCFVKLRTSEPQHCGYATLHHRQQLAAYMSLVRPTDTHCHTDTVLTVVLNTPPQISIWNPYTWWTSVDWRWFKVEGLDLSNTDTRADPVNY